MTDIQTIDQRLAHIEKALPSLSTFNLNVLAILGRAVNELDESKRESLRASLDGLKSIRYEGLDVGLINSHIDAITQMIFEVKAR